MLSGTIAISARRSSQRPVSKYASARTACAWPSLIEVPTWLASWQAWLATASASAYRFRFPSAADGLWAAAAVGCYTHVRLTARSALIVHPLHNVRGG
jgi:hypothetical protein